MLATLEAETLHGKANELEPTGLGYSLFNLAHQETFLTVQKLIYPTGCHEGKCEI